VDAIFWGTPDFTVLWRPYSMGDTLFLRLFTLSGALFHGWRPIPFIEGDFSLVKPRNSGPYSRMRYIVLTRSKCLVGAQYLSVHRNPTRRLVWGPCYCLERSSWIFVALSDTFSSCYEGNCVLRGEPRGRETENTEEKVDYGLLWDKPGSIRNGDKVWNWTHLR
jgi:hypothetical protein